MKTDPDLSILIPDTISKIQFNDIFDLDEIQHLQDLFSDATGVASIITRPDGTPITNSSNFCKFCNIIRKTEKGRANCFKSDAIIGRQNSTGPIKQQCLSGGLWDAGASITVGGIHIANWLIGQVRNEEVDEKRMVQYADEIGANHAEFMEALREVPAMSVVQFNKVSKMLFAFANELSDNAYRNLLLKMQITEREKTNKLLLVSEAIQRKMVENIGDVIIIIDQNGISKYKSPNIERLFGWTPEEVVGNSIWGKVYPDDLDPIQKSFSNLLDKPNASAQAECRLLCKDGSYKWIEITAVNLLHDPDIKGILGNYHDITERKLAEVALTMAKDKAEENDKLKTSFLNNISHEIRTPFNGILGFLSLLQENDLAESDRDEYIGIINNSAYRLMNTINDIVEISQIQAGQIQTTIAETNIRKLASGVYTHFKADAESKGLKFFITNDLPVNIDCINTDSAKLNAILTILIGNALKFTPTGSIEFGIKLTDNIDKQIVETHDRTSNDLETHDRTSLLQFSVKDTGIGIFENKREVIFDRFVQADVSSTRQFDGSGLGLSIAKAYVEMLDGNIWVESEEGKGAEFIFTIPDRGKPKEKNVPKSALLRTATENHNDPEVSGLKILIVEDDEESALLLEIDVRLFGKKILRVRSGVEAIEVCRNNLDIDLVLMDIKMPHLNGYETTRQIRKFNNKMVIIAQTAYALTGDREKAIEAGCDDYISKPINKDQLLALVQKYFNK